MRLTKDDRQMLAERFGETWSDKKMVDYCVGKTSAYVELNDGSVLTIDKPRIETEFWFGEHGFDFDEKQELCHRLSKDEAYFFAENMNRCEASRKLKKIADDYEAWAAPMYSGSDSIVCLRFHRSWEDDKQGRMLDDDERAAVTAMLQDECDKFGKRLTSYLKRYGLSKCRFSTYWADR